MFGTLWLAVAVVATLLTGASRAATCDTDFIRARAEQAVAGYSVEAVSADRSIVTLLFSARTGDARFAIALYASGTTLSTSMMGLRIGREELERVSRPVNTWWKDAEIQRVLAACCAAESAPEPLGDRSAALDRAAERALGHRDSGWALAAWTVPTTFALALALLQVAILAATVIRAVTTFNGAADGTSRVSWIALLVIATSALVVARRFGGPSAMVWSDTFNDQAEVQRCLELGECTLYGMGTSVPGFAHAGGWLQLRDLSSALGLTLDRQTLLLHVLDACGVMVAALVAWQLGGPTAAAIATVAVWNRYGMVGVKYDALYNSLPFPFLGAVLLAACTYAVERPSPRSVAVAGLVGAILANVHFAGVSCGITSSVIGLLAPRRRSRLMLIGAAAFGLGTLAISPATWLHAAAYVIGHPGGERREIATAPLTAEPLAVDGLCVIAVWVLALLLGRRVAGFRRRLDASVAIIAPPLALFCVAALGGRINPTGKYIAQLRAPTAVAMAVIVAASLGVLGQLASHSIGRFPRFWKSWGLILARSIPYVGAALLLTCKPDAAQGPDLRLRDIDAAAEVLRDDLRWDFAATVRNLKAPSNHDILTAWKSLYPGWVRSRPASTGQMAGPSAVLLKVFAHDLPDPMQKDWRMLSASSSEATLLALVPSWIDWTHYTACLFGRHGDARQCVETGLVDRGSLYRIELDGMPGPEDTQSGGILQLRFPLRAAEPGQVHEVFMPRYPNQTCSGRVVSVPEGSSITSDGRHATLVASPNRAEPPVLVVEWDLGACPVGYSGLPPFFLEGDAAAVGPLRDLIKTAWEHGTER